MQKTLLIDCDGVLYPTTQLSLKDILSAMKDVYRKDVGLSGAEQAKVSKRTLCENHLGAFNYIKEICREKKYDFSLFCEQMANRTNYGRVQPNPQLWDLLANTARNYNTVILSNNSRQHISKILSAVFGKDVDAVENNGIKVCDITFTETDGYFLPKQSDNGLSVIAGKLKVLPADCVLLDDSSVNVQAARRQGMQGFLISKEKTLAQYLKSLGQNFSSRKDKTYE